MELAYSIIESRGKEEIDRVPADIHAAISAGELLPLVEVGASLFNHNGYYHTHMSSFPVMSEGVDSACPMPILCFTDLYSQFFFVTIDTQPLITDVYG